MGMHLNVPKFHKSLRTRNREVLQISPLPLKNFDDSNSGIQAPFKLPADAKEVDYFKVFFDHELVCDIRKVMHTSF